MADLETKNTVDNNDVDTNKDVNTTPDGKEPNKDDSSKQPSIAELQAQMQELMTENAKLKRASDKNSAEASEYKKKWKASLSEVEQANMEKAERDAEREEQFKSLVRENQINKLEKSYLAMGYTADESSRMATAEADGDFEEKVKIMAEVDARKKKEYEAEFLKNRPDVNAGTGGTSITKEQFDSMGMVEKSTLRRENPDEYDRLMKL